MKDIEIDGIAYRIGRMNAIQQWEVFRRLGPMVPVLALEYRDGADQTPGGRWIMGGASGALSELKQADSDYILQACLAAVERKGPGDAQWYKFAVNGRLMYENDSDLSLLLALMDEVVQENLASFFARLRSASAAAEQAT